MTRKQSYLVAALAALGALMLIAGTVLHPSSADPAQAEAAFAEYAADPLWVTSHLTQLGGVALMLLSQVLLVEWRASAGGLARLSLVGAAASLSVAAILQAVDGVALKPMTEAWVAAPEASRDAALRSAMAVRHIEVGLAAMFGIVGGLTILAFAVMHWRMDLPKWLAVLGGLGAVGTFAGGLAMAYTGFSGLSMSINMPAGIALTLWMLVLAVVLVRRS